MRAENQVAIAVADLELQTNLTKLQLLPYLHSLSGPA